MTKYLVTGANGFVGSRLCMTMAEKGLSVRAAVRKTDKIECLSSVEVVEIRDCGPSTDWSYVLKGIDVIIHLAARAHVMHETAADPLHEFRRVNAEGTRNLAMQASRAGISRIVYLSTIKVNGELTHEEPFNEDSPLAPQDAYAMSKWEAEDALHAISASSGLEIVIIRTPLVYGPGVKGNMLKLMKQINHGIPLPLGMITNRRSLISLENLVDILILSASRSECIGQTFAVSDGEDISTSDLVFLLSKAMGKKVRLIPFPSRLCSLFTRLAPSLKPTVDRLAGSLIVDSSRFRERMKWSPPQTISTGIDSMVSDFLRLRNHVG